MKAAYTLLLAGCLILCLFSCSKNSDSVNPTDIVGKWYENKLNIRQQNTNTGAVRDTTYAGNNFAKFDYFQFNRDSTAVISSSDVFFTVYGKGYLFTTNSSDGNQLYYRWYKVKDTTLTLQIGFIPTCLDCSQPGPYNETILKLDANNLVLKAAGPDTSATYKTTTVTYYTKQPAQ